MPLIRLWGRQYVLDCVRGQSGSTTIRLLKGQALGTAAFLRHGRSNSAAAQGMLRLRLGAADEARTELA